MEELFDYLEEGVELFKKADGQWGGNIASLDQNQRYIPVSEVKLEVDKLTVQIAGAPVFIQVNVESGNNKLIGKFNEGSSACWDVVDERGMDIWINANDPYLRSRFKQIYDVRVTPQVFVLDSEKKIVMKKIGVEQLSGVMDHLFEEKSD